MGNECTAKELYKRTKVEIVGVSKDPVEKQKAFVEKQKLTVRKSLAFPSYLINRKSTVSTLF